MKNNERQVTSPVPEASAQNVTRLPLQSVPVMRTVVHSGLSGDVGLDMSDYDHDYAPINYFVHVQ
jgi:hypothetical protein